MRRELLKKPHVLICSAEFLASDEVIHVQIRFFMEALRKEIPDYLGSGKVLKMISIIAGTHLAHSQ